MQYTKNFTELGKDDAQIAGGKGASLGEMTTAGIPVPGGYVVLANTFDAFLKETDLVQEIDTILDGVNHETIHTVEAASESIQALILSRPMPEAMQTEIQEKFQVLGSQYVAVRSSATAEDGAEHAWAGQLDSFLNTTESDLIEKVRRCWASLFTPRAIFYRFEKGLHATHISVAVVVQKMVNSEKSGIAFSVHPVTEDYNQLIIEAGFGLGEAIVSGSVTPDSYVVEKSPRSILDVNVSHQGRALYRIEGGGSEWKDLSEAVGNSQVLDGSQIQELSDIILRIENHYGFPCDIEWAAAFEKSEGPEELEGQKLVFYIVQSRPITTLAPQEKKAAQKIEKIFSRDFTLIALEMDYRMEYQKARPWADGDNPYSPYLVFWHDDGTSKIYFNSLGVEWIQWELEKKVREDSMFLFQVEKKVREGIAAIRPLYESYTILDREKLVCFVEDFMRAYHWIEAMWWIKSMSEDRLADVDCTNIIKLREETEMLSAATDIVIRKSLAEMYPELGLLSAMISLDELKRDDIPQKEVLEKRDREFVLINNEVILEKSFEEVLRENNIELVSEPQKVFGEYLQGQSASKGTYTGRVVRVMGHNDFNKVQEGDVLISPMTMVDFLPVMKKAGAFITDEGGALCHAAIVARELGKPCVIGTEVSTETLKDGDLVEVDADNGVVRILEREEKVDIGNYQKLFQWPGEFSHFLSSYFMAIYNKHKAISLHDGSMWQSFLPHASKEKTLKSGLILYSSEQKYNELKKGLTEGFVMLANHFEQILKKDFLTKKDVESLFNEALQHYNYYSQTEFFFTDLAYAEMSNVSQIQKNFETFDELKLQGREYLNKIALAPGCYLDRLLEKIAGQLDCDVSSLKRHSINEILELFDGSVVVSDELVNRNQYFMHGKGAYAEVLTGTVALEKIRDFFEEMTSASELKGQVANKGYCRGSARVFRFSIAEINRMHEEIEKMEQGEILIADTTAPEIILACKKAGAIVTNQGGMMSHAAIVARELNIPCIVGTGYITEVVKTGDVLEVDADSGIIRIV